MQLSEVKEGMCGSAVKFAVAQGLKIALQKYIGVGERGTDISIRFVGAKRKVSAFDRNQISFGQPTVGVGRKGFAFHLGLLSRENNVEDSLIWESKS
jgi:hypothetical protein